MRAPKILIFPAIFLFLAFFACTKLYNPGYLGPNNSQGGTAVFALAGGDSSCQAVTLQGSYTAATPVTDSNTVTVTVNVITAGTYVLSTPTVNGVTFNAKDTFTTTGNQTVKLTASGTPTAPGTFSYTVGANGCSYTITVSSTTAVFALTGSPNACATATVNGTYTAGTATGAGNTVAIAANVTTAGAYNITTPTVNGITFSGSGQVAVGVQNIILTASGTPTAAGTNNYTAGINGCSFPVTVGAATTGAAVFTLNGSPNACTTATVNGTYTAGTATGAGNTVAIAANVTTAGQYSITTATVNGITFSGSGQLAVGAQTITLKAAGTPVAAATSNFTAGTGGCSFPVTVSAAASAAVFTMAGAPNACTNAVVNGTYQAGTALTSANTVTVYVNVTSPGSYLIATTLTNGISFSAMGSFATIGNNIPVTLTGSGTPTAAGTPSFSAVSNGTAAGCTFNVTVAAAPAYNSVYSATIGGVNFNFTVQAAASLTNVLTGVPDLTTDGYMGQPNGSYRPELQLSIANNSNAPVTTGSYNTNQSSAINIFTGYQITINYSAVNPDNSVTIWSTSSSLFTTNPFFTIVVTGVSATSVQGTFSGTLTNVFEGSTKTLTVTNGTFDLQVQ